MLDFLGCGMFECQFYLKVLRDKRAPSSGVSSHFIPW
jgi:hypothetical protein